MENRISITISNEAIATIEQNLPTLINLTKEERHELLKMGYSLNSIEL